MEIKKPCIAIIIPGGIGTGHNNIGVPVLERIIRHLSIRYAITVFQLFKVDKNYRVDGFELIPVYSSSALFRTLKFLWKFFVARRNQKFQAIHGFWAMPCGFLAVLGGKLSGIKSIVSVLGGDAVSLPGIGYGQLRNPLYRRLTRWTLHHATEANALTDYLKNNLKQAGIQRSDLEIIPWGIEIDRFTFKEKPVQSPVQFLHIANLHPVKDQETLLRAFKIIQDAKQAHLTIIGEGVSENFVRQLISKLGLEENVTIIGLLPYDELPAYYHRADILLHTSLSEGQSEVVTEAMSCGVVVCGTRVGLMFDLPDCCVTVPVGDYEALANETMKLISNPDQMRTLRNRAHVWTTAHSLDWTVDKIAECYNSTEHASQNI